MYSITRKSFRRSPFFSCLHRKKNSSPFSLRKISFFGRSFDAKMSIDDDIRTTYIYTQLVKRHCRRTPTSLVVLTTFTSEWRYWCSGRISGRVLN